MYIRKYKSRSGFFRMYLSHAIAQHKYITNINRKNLDHKLVRPRTRARARPGPVVSPARAGDGELHAVDPDPVARAVDTHHTPPLEYYGILRVGFSPGRVCRS